VSDTVFKSIFLPGTTEAVVDGALQESEENPLQPATPLEQANQPGEAGAPLKLTGEQTIRTASELHKALAAYIERSPSVVLDLSEVQVWDAAALQLIYALRQSAAQCNQRFHIKAVSEAITETAAALGLRIEALTTPCEPAVPQGDSEVLGIDIGI
jgi:anti-anti-sigma factor